MIMSKIGSFLTAAAALAVPSLIWAVPADPRPRTLTNPDGSTVTVRVHGDEHFSFMTDVACTTIMHRDADGFLVNEVRNGAPLLFNKTTVEMLRAEKESASLTRSGESGPQRMATLNTEGRSTYPTIGEGNRSLVVLVEFQDQEFTVANPKEYFTRQLNEPGFSDYGGSGSALDYYKAVSNGKYVPQFDVYGPVKISKNTSYFADENTKTKNMELLIREALTALHDSGELDLSNYDLDNNGTLDTVFIYYAGFGSADSDTQTIWPHQSVYWNGGTPLRFDGIKVGPYACANELKGWNPTTGIAAGKEGYEPWVDGVGTFIHEYGHVLGLPDLYDVEYSGEAVTPGEWDVMDSGCYNFNGCVPPLYSAYEQWVCNWLEYTDAEDATHYDLASLGTAENLQAVRIRIPMNADKTKFNSEYFVIESRDNSGWDKCFPYPGLMVWRINFQKNLWTSNSVNSRNGSNVEIVLAKNSKNPLFDTGAIYPGANVELIPSKDYSLWVSPVISSISYDSTQKIGSFDYNMMTPPDHATVLHDNPKAADGSRSFTLEWDPVEGVDSYLVTVKTVKSQRIVDNFDAKDVGLATKALVSGLSSTYWKLEMEAYVQCVVGGMLSSKTSNVIKFKPSDLEIDDNEGAVDGIDADDIHISGSVGCVIAPEGAVIYNMAGQQLRNENLTPGIYLVSFAGRTAKVLVR